MADPREAVASLHAGMGDARPSNLRLGRQIATGGSIEFAVEDDLIVAVVAGSRLTSKRTVRFSPGDSHTAWSWSCTCMKDESPWCKHVVAAVVAAHDEDRA